MSDLRTTIVQTDISWEAVDENLQQLESKLATLSGQTDLIVLPEMFTTGFSMQPEGLAEAPKGRTFGWMQRQAVKLQAAVTGSLIVRENDRYYNRLYWVKPDGSHHTYDKRHLFTLAGEHHHYASGEERTLINYRGWRVLPLICYDLRFPVWSRNTVDYDLLIYVANWPTPRSLHWRQLLCARAIENQAYTIGVNRVGYDGNDHHYRGDSCIIDYAGQHLAQLALSEQIVTCTLDLEAQQSFRQKLAFLDDRDKFVMK